MTPKSLMWLDPHDDEAPFPDVEDALLEPNGLLAVGGDLSPTRLLRAYRQGVFPWYSDDQPILWWSPDPRAVLRPDHLKISRSLRKTLKNGAYTVTADKAFRRVIECCAEPRYIDTGTWITHDMVEAYCRLHDMGYAHSVETWSQDELVGGLYGVCLGKIFFGESMFTRRTDASKVAFVRLVERLREWGFVLIDCQVESAHLTSLGAEAMPRRAFVAELDRHCDIPSPWRPWEDRYG